VTGDTNVKCGMQMWQSGKCAEFVKKQNATNKTHNKFSCDFNLFAFQVRDELNIASKLFSLSPPLSSRCFVLFLGS